MLQEGKGNKWESWWAPSPFAKQMTDLMEEIKVAVRWTRVQPNSEEHRATDFTRRLAARNFLISPSIVP